jgi:putative peptide zinc metalloprotease protein
MRPDLIARRQRWQGREFWTVKDPLALRYFRFEAEEFAILSMLDGQTSAEQICERFEQQFVPQRLPSGQLQQLLVMLHRSNLLIADALGQGQQLLTRHRDRQRRVRIGTLTNFLAIRIRGIDPDRILTWLDGWVGWVFSAPAAVAALAIALSAILLVFAEFQTFEARLPAFHAFFAAQNWLWLAMTLAATKVLHEIGHGLACKRFGGECHEMGLMLLVFTPCLYCNVSDAWMIPSKWRRAAIGAAGMYIELILAAVATFLWWLSEPGLFNHLCLNVMFVCSVSTVLFNANPLMRFDGYYILSDILEIPNLRQKSAAVIQRKLAKWILGLRERPDPFLPTRRRWLFALYSIAASIYGWLVMLSIFWFLYRALEPYGLKVIGQLLAATMIAGLVVAPAMRMLHFLFEPARSQNVKKTRAAIVLTLIFGAIAGLLCIPLPYYVACSFEVQPRGADSVYVDVPGELREVILDGGAVQPGAALARLDNIEARLAHQRLLSQRAELATRIDIIRQRAVTDDAALLELSQTEEALTALDQQLRRLEEDLAKLTIRAPREGIIVPPASRPANKIDRMQLAGWSGRPLDSRNLGAYLDAGTLVCRIAEPGQFDAILAIDEAELEFVHSGQAVDLLVTSMPGQRHAGRIERIAEEKMHAAPVRLAAAGGGTLTTREGKDGALRPLAVLYQANVPLDDARGGIIVGATGVASVHAGWQPLGQRLWRAACRTFRLQM